MQAPLALLDDSEPEPDLAVVPLGDYSSRHPHDVDLVIEVAGGSLRRDRAVKGPLYAGVVGTFGILRFRRRPLSLEPFALTKS